MENNSTVHKTQHEQQSLTRLNLIKSPRMTSGNETVLLPSECRDPEQAQLQLMHTGNSTKTECLDRHILHPALNTKHNAGLNCTC